MTEPVPGGAVAARLPHKQEVGGSNPPRASIPTRTHDSDRIGHILDASTDEWALLFVPL
jgi:hypothetical protein